MASEINLSQQEEIFSPSHAHPVTVIGIGAVGSHVPPMLAKLGAEDITAIDGDGIESHNISMSRYHRGHLGMLKTAALQKIVLMESGLEIKTIPKMYAGEPLRDTVVACVDNMETRSLIWSCVKENPLVDIFIDTRTAKELLWVFAINPCDPKDIRYYENFLYPSSEAVHPTCGEHGIGPISELAASVVCRNLINWWQNGQKERHYQELCIKLLRV